MKVLEVILIQVLIACHAQTRLDLVKFDELFSLQTGGRCLDGSPAGYYFRRGFGSGGLRWVIYMQGGGECTTQASCSQRVRGALGSSDFWQPTSIRRGNLVDDDPAVNPDFYNWNHIYIPYCTGDWFTGTQLLQNEWGFYFSGHFHVRAVIQHATRFFSLSFATDVLVSGSSAGALGTYVNADVIAAILPDTVTVKASPQDGWFFPNPVDSYPDWSMNQTTPLRDIYLLWNPLIDTQCALDNPGEEALCTSTGYTYGYMETPAYVLNNRFDSCLMYTDLNAPRNDDSALTLQFFEYVGNAMLQSTQQIINSPKDDGLFLMSCLEHASNNGLQNIRIDDFTYGQSLGDWYFERNQVPHVLIDDCGSLPCTPGCRNSPLVKVDTQDPVVCDK